MKRRTRIDTDSAIAIDGADGTSPAQSIRVSVQAVREFLSKTIDDDVDIIVSTLRKGTWIVTDYLRTTRQSITHVTTDSVRAEDVAGRNVLLFDDSIHTGKGVIDSKNKLRTAKSVRIACLAINNDAIRNIMSEFGDDISIASLRTFAEYVRNDKEGGLADGCQAYFYSYFIIPYIESLTVTYSPDFTCLSVFVEGSSQMEMHRLLDSVLGTLPGSDRGNDSSVSENKNCLRSTKALGSHDVSRYLEQYGSGCSEDMQKVRVSVSAYADRMEAVVTPMICPRMGAGNDDLNRVPTDISRAFIDKYRAPIEEGVRNSGFRILNSALVEGALREGGDPWP